MIDNLIMTQIQTGIVESVDDPNQAGRIKVRVQGQHDNMTTEQLSWSSPAGISTFSGNGGGSISIPRVGSHVRVKPVGNDPKELEYLGCIQPDPDMLNEIKDDYQGSTVLMYDSAVNASIRVQPNNGMILTFKGSRIQILPDNTIIIHYGEDSSATQIQLSQGKIDIQAQNQINLSTSGNINLEADNITLNAKSSVQLKGSMPGDCAVNGKQLVTLLSTLAAQIDTKNPMSFGLCQQLVNCTKNAILNEKINLI